MISAAVIEDNKDFAEILRKKIEESDWEENISVSVYDGPEEFLKDMEGNTAGKVWEGKSEQKQADVAFLDVEMPGMNGMELAERIRMADREMILVFVSSFSEYAMEGYQVYAFDYLLKSRLDQKWDRLVERLRAALGKGREEMYTIQTANRTERIPVNDILYIYKEEKYVVIVTEAERFALRKTMQDTALEFEKYRQFIQVKRGILINMEKIRRATARELLMNNGEYITIGRMYVDKVREQLHAYLGDKR